MNKEKIHTGLLQAELIGNKVLESLKRSRNGLLGHDVFEHAIYIYDGNEVLIKIIKDKEFVSPNSIVISGMGDLSFKSLDIENGTKLEFYDDKIASKENGFTVNIASASIWNPPELPDESDLLSVEEINLNQRILNDIIYTSPSRDGLVPLLENVEKYGPLEVFVKEQKPTISEKARPYIDVLMWGILSGDIEAIKRSAGSILGLGPGLTPSCDDFLAGLMLSLNNAGASLFRNVRLQRWGPRSGRSPADRGRRSARGRCFRPSRPTSRPGRGTRAAPGRTDSPPLPPGAIRGSTSGNSILPQIPTASFPCSSYK